AKTGEFGTGNDVALVSSPAFGVSSALLSSQTVTLDYASESHYLDATLVPRYTCSQFQLSTAVWTQQYPAWANATFSFMSEDSTIASVDPSTGLVTFLPQEEEEGSDCPTCRILVTATLAGQSPQTIEIRLTGASIEDTYCVPDGDSADGSTYAFDPSKSVLVLYNYDSADSTALAQYYQANRPGMGNAIYIPISAAALIAAGYTNIGVTSEQGLPDTAGTSCASDAICNAIASYVIQEMQDLNWLGADQSQPVDPIRYIVGLCGLPSRDVDGDSVSYMIYQDALNISHGTGYQNGADRFSLAEYGAPLVAWLDCGSYAATNAYIDKEVAAADANGLESDGITISGNAAGVGGNTWVLDDTCYGADGNGSTYANDGDAATFFDSFMPTLTPDLPAGSVVDHNTGATGIGGNGYGPCVATAANPTAYGSWGVHSGELHGGSPLNWSNNGQVTFTGNAGWWVGMSVESYNGIYSSGMANPTSVFSANAFGSDNNYANTPICWVGSTHEPWLANNEDVAYFDRWARGWSTLESAWAGRQTPYFVAVTDICLEP
ncbi:MAG: hypothetical protein WCB27_01180, partial [Thermoguttaceae bacterium]